GKLGSASATTIGRRNNWPRGWSWRTNSLSWENSGSAGGLATFDNFGNGPSRCIKRQGDSPHPGPLPRGEGTVGGRFGYLGGSSGRPRAGLCCKTAHDSPSPRGRGPG